MPYDVPVLFLTFNRPQHTLVVLERLRILQPGRIYIHCDGPRRHHKDDEKNVTAVRAVIEKQIDWPCEIQTLYRTTNMGLRDGVFDAINWFFKHEPEGIIVEDDCVPDLSFFRFCQMMLRSCTSEVLTWLKNGPPIIRIVIFFPGFHSFGAGQAGGGHGKK